MGGYGTHLILFFILQLSAKRVNDAMKTLFSIVFFYVSPIGEYVSSLMFAAEAVSAFCIILLFYLIKQLYP